MEQKKDKVQIFFEAWAEYAAGYIKEEILRKLGFEKFIDLKFHIWNVFFFNMFYKCVKGEEDLPNICDVNGDEYSDNAPINWLKRYDASSYFYEDEDLQDYISMQLCVKDESPAREVFVIFKKNDNTNNPPYKLVAISSGCTKFACNEREMDWQTAIEIANSSKAQRLIPFEKVSDVIFQCELLNNWDNRDKLSINYEHLLRDHPERVKKNGEVLYKKEDIIQMVMEACYISKGDYRYAYPYIFYDANEKKKETKGLKRGFFLPLIEKKKLILVASIVETRPKSNRYRISTFLSPDDAIKDVKRFSLIEENWIIKYIYRKDEDEVVDEKS